MNNTTTPYVPPPVDHIDDGYTISKSVEATDRHGPFAFRYRPLIGDEWNRLVDAFANRDRRSEVGLSLVQQHVFGWSLRNGETAVPVTRKTLLRVSEALLFVMVDALLGVQPAGGSDSPADPFTPASRIAADLKNLQVGLSFWLNHPKIANRTCASCQKYRYTEAGDIEMNERVKPALPVLRGDLPTPCETCPRKSPDREAETTLSEKNWKAYTYYLEVRATRGACLIGRQKTDPLSRKILGTIDAIVRDFELGILCQAFSVASFAAAARAMVSR